MSFLDALRHRLRVRLRPRAYMRELEEEMEFHLSLDAMQREHDARAALSSADARHAARRRFGNLTAVTLETRHVAGLGLFDSARADLRFALRSFRRTPGFTAVAVLTLAVGIGANTAIYGAVHAMLLRPLPFREPEQLMQLRMTILPGAPTPANDDVPWSYPKFATFRDAQPIFQELGIYQDNQFTVRGGGGDPERTGGEFVGAGYLRTLGVSPQLGRNFLPAEDAAPAGPRVVMLGDALWKRRFNADPNVLGRAVDVDGQPFTIVGVLPPGFRGLTGDAELFVSVMSQPAEYVNEAWNHAYALVARRKPGVSAQQAAGVVRELGRRVDAAYPNPDVRSEHWGAAARPLDAVRVDPVVRRSLLVLLGAVGLVLLVACANVANLFLVRAAGRRREIGVRLAIGAGRGRLVRQLLTESLLLSALGGAASVVVAWWGTHLLAALDPSSALGVQRLRGLGAVTFSSIRLDLPALAVTAALALTTGLVFGLVPALQTTRPSLVGALKDDGAGSSAAPGGRGLRRLASRDALAVIEIALALVLLAGSGLMLRSLGKLMRVDPGFDAEHTLTLRLNAADGTTRDSLPGFYDQVLERLAAVPGVTGAAFTDCPPLNGGCNGTVVWLRDRPAVAAGKEPSVGVHWVSPSWPTVLRVPLERGRPFTSADRLGARKVVLVSETAARTIWPGEDPIGRPLSVGQGGFHRDTAYVVGVVGDVRYGTLDEVPRSDVYLSYYQSPRGQMMLFLRTAGNPVAVAGAARRALAEAAPGVLVYDIRPMTGRVADATSYARFATLLLALFAAVALALAALGTYGVVSFSVAQRTREIGVRVALGATTGDVARLVLGQGARIAVAGAALGLAGALAATRVLGSLLYDVAPGDPATYVTIVALLALAVMAASWLPMRRAVGIAPVQAMREG